MPVLAGDILTADTLNHLKPTTYHADATATLAASSTDADITGATVTFTTETAGAIYIATGNFYILFTGSGSADEQGKLAVDGAIQTPKCHFRDNNPNAVSGEACSISETWSGSLGAAGSHTIKLKGTTGSGCTIGLTDTGLTVVIYEVV